jgi:hypothetical protein
VDFQADVVWTETLPDRLHKGSQKVDNNQRVKIDICLAANTKLFAQQNGKEKADCNICQGQNIVFYLFV